MRIVVVSELKITEDDPYMDEDDFLLGAWPEDEFDEQWPTQWVNIAKLKRMRMLYAWFQSDMEICTRNNRYWQEDPDYPVEIPRAFIVEVWEGKKRLSQELHKVQLDVPFLEHRMVQHIERGGRAHGHR